jgi:hypothetical protein
MRPIAFAVHRSLILYVAIGYTERDPSVNKPKLEIWRDVQLPARPAWRFCKPWHWRWRPR